MVSNEFRNSEMRGKTHLMLPSPLVTNVRAKVDYKSRRHNFFPPCHILVKVLFGLFQSPSYVTITDTFTKNKKATMASESPNPSPTTPGIMSSSTRKPRTSFLTLPRELRHKIIYHSCDICIYFETGNYLFDGVIHRRKHINTCSAEEQLRSGLWARLLGKAGKEFEVDVGYVLDLWQKEVEEMARECLENRS